MTRRGRRVFEGRTAAFVPVAFCFCAATQARLPVQQVLGVSRDDLVHVAVRRAEVTPGAARLRLQRGEELDSGVLHSLPKPCSIVVTRVGVLDGNLPAIRLRIPAKLPLVGGGLFVAGTTTEANDGGCTTRVSPGSFDGCCASGSPRGASERSDHLHVGGT